MEEHDRIADEGLEDADRIEEASEKLQKDIQDTREDWESKQGQEGVPGAVDPDKFHPDEDDEEEERPEPEYRELNPQSADASGGGQSDSGESDDADDDS